MRFLAFFFVIFCAACATPDHFNVNVSGLVSSQLTVQSTFDVLPADENTSAQDLQFQEYKSYIVRALSQKGFLPVADGDVPDIIVFLDYGIGEPQTKVASYNVPIFGQTGVSSKTTTGTANTTFNTYGSYGSANTTYSQTTNYNPTYGITGYTTNTYSYDVHRRYVTLDGFFTFSWAEEQKLTPAFQTSIVSTGTSGDLRRVLPVMVGAASQYIGQSTSNAVQVTLTEDDARVLQVKGIE